MTKDEASDLTSLHNRVVECTVDLKLAELRKGDADCAYEGYLWKLVHEKKEPAK